MRRGILAVGAVIMFLYCATPSEGGWLFHHHLFHHGHAHGGAMAQPLTFQLPGGVGVNVDLQQLLGHVLGQQQQQQQQQQQKAATVQISPDVTTKVADVQTAVNAGVDELNTLTDRMNKKLKANPNLVPDALKKDGKFTPLDKLDAPTSGKTTGKTGVSGGPA